MLLKNARIKNKKLTDFARGQSCTLNIAGVCNYDSKTSVWCHYNFEGGCMGGKTHDHSGGIGCSSCHAYLDANKLSKEDWYFYTGRSMVRSRTLAIQAGVVNG